MTLWYFSQLSCKIGHKGQTLPKPDVVLPSSVIQLISFYNVAVKSQFFSYVERQWHSMVYFPSKTWTKQIQEGKPDPVHPLVLSYLDSLCRPKKLQQLVHAQGLQLVLS